MPFETDPMSAEEEETMNEQDLRALIEEVKSGKLRAAASSSAWRAWA